MSLCTLRPHEHIILDILNESEILHNLKKKLEDFPGGLVVKNLPANVGDMDSIPGAWKIPHAAEN